MPFDITTRTVLEYYTAHPPRTEDVWDTWSLPNVLPDDSDSHIPDFVIEVVKLSTPPLTFRTVLIVKVKNSQYWEAGIPVLQRQIDRQTDAAFAGTAFEKVYWIGTIGPHWRYGIKEDDGRDPRPLINWHHITHDQVSFDDLQILTRLIGEM
ncbi:hypothetical protein ARMSODRAFT_1021295 [Armillaria solidipes]|uniref:Uncharacterized protein n=1 Tax=Armillaria solidipes TaxID=1076256 RepID=A0A2H3B6E4_9AGAR|nr:hypothetical protein ARMSODRAFT_1021295 [Armillaria solidipes]